MSRASKPLAVAVLTLSFLSSAALFARGADRTALVVSSGPTAAAEREALIAAIAMLPRQPVRIAVIDVSQNRAPIRDDLLTLDAFTVEGSGVWYIVQQSTILKRACALRCLQALRKRPDDTALARR